MKEFNGVLRKKPLDPGMPPVIALGGGIIALSIARILSQSGIRVYALDEARSYARHSRFSTWISVPSNGNPQTAWREWLLGEGARRLNGAVILPGSDDALELISVFRDELRKHYILPEANDEIVLAMLDKAKTFELSRKVSVPSPNIWIVNTREEVADIATKISYPCALKPRHSHIFTRTFPKLKVILINNAGELLRHFDSVHQLGLEMVVTEIIPGNEDQYYSYYTYLDEKGNPLFHFTKRKLRQYPNGFGHWTYHVSGWYPEAAELGLRLFQRSGLRGIGTVEFKRDPRDGQLKLIECNPRFTVAIELLKVSGINWALFVYNKLVGRPLPDTSTFDEGVRVLKPLSDFLAFSVSHRRGELSWTKWIRSLLYRQHFQYHKWSDPMPTIMRIIPFLLRQVKKDH